MYRKTSKRCFGAQTCPMPQHELTELISTNNEAVSVIEKYINKTQTKRDTLDSLNNIVAKINQKIATLS
jgi:transcriptional regulator